MNVRRMGGWRLGWERKLRMSQWLVLVSEAMHDDSLCDRALKNSPAREQTRNAAQPTIATKMYESALAEKQISQSDYRKASPLPPR
jgi:hypothetical protein